MIVDLHAHYPMHVVERGKVSLWRVLSSESDRLGLLYRVEATLVHFAGRFRNYRSFCSGPRVRMKYMREGGVGVALSVLYSFFDEIEGFDEDKPESGALGPLEAQRKAVVARIAELHSERAAVTRNPAELARAHSEGKTAIVHCVEGGFRLGATPAEIDASVAQLAEEGIAYITLAHLWWRGVATDAPALPTMTDAEYHEHYPQPDFGLSDLGKAAVEAMVRERVLIDLAHMSEHAVKDTLDLLDKIDPGKEAPVLVTHAGYRFGEQEYMLSEATIERIAERKGVIGLIFARHQLEDRLPKRPKRPLPPTRKGQFKRSLRILREHIDRIEAITGSHSHTAIGSDLDGFIKPTLPGLEDMRDMAKLEAALVQHYGTENAAAICSDNALNLLSTYWRGRQTRD